MQLEQICREETDLSEVEIEDLRGIEENIQYIADLTGSDVFIDCKTRDGDMIVVAEARPAGLQSAYRHSVVGKRALQEKEPAVYYTFSSMTPSHDIIGITQEGISVKQDVIPIKKDNGKILGVLIREKDVSPLVQQAKKYEALAETLENRENFNENITGEAQTAMQEVNHRVKNHLQMVASILNMQSRLQSNLNVKNILKENANRILCIAHIHDILTDINQESIDLYDLLQRFKDNIGALLPEEKQIKIEICGSSMMLSAKQASALALCLNELITNAAIHAFQDREAGIIEMILEDGIAYSKVLVSDNGIGFDPSRRDGARLGLELIEATVRDKLKGSFKIFSGDEGTKAIIEFRRK